MVKIYRKEKDYPIIYLRYLNNKLIYVGESGSLFSNRHVRLPEHDRGSDAGDFDLVKTLKAPKDKMKRQYWEAYLVLKMKPKKQMSPNKICVYQARWDKRNFPKIDPLKKLKYKMKSEDGHNIKQIYLNAAKQHMERFEDYMDRIKRL